MAKDALTVGDNAMFFKVPDNTLEKPVQEEPLSAKRGLGSASTSLGRQALNRDESVEYGSDSKGEARFNANPVLDITDHLRKINMLVSGSLQSKVYTDEYRRIKRPLLSNAFGKTASLVERGNLIMVTSAVPGEGKSYSAVNLALSIAQEKDHTVLLVDCDVAHKGASRMLRADNRQGLIEVLDSSSMCIGDVLVPTDVPSLSIIPAGMHNDYVTELLASHRMGEVVAEIGARYDDRVIIFDAPPLLPTPQTLVLAMLVGQIVFVVESGISAQSIVMEELDMLPEDVATALLMNKSEGMSQRNKSYNDY